MLIIPFFHESIDDITDMEMSSIFFHRASIARTFLSATGYAVSHSPEMEEFVSIRVHSWFLLSPAFFFVLFVCFVVK